MGLKNTQERYGSVAIFLHWVMAILIIVMLGLGLYMTRIPISPWKLKLFGWHKELGALVLMLVTLRIVWYLAGIFPSLSTLPRWERVAARVVHWALYGFMFALPISGWLMTSAAGFHVSFFGWFVLPDLILPNEHLRPLFAQAHKWLGYGLIAVICLHIVAALKHHFIDKDDILRRMV